ncbi:MAG: hypothetical protein AB7O59_02875 [Pirellulales bacterium]
MKKVCVIAICGAVAVLAIETQRAAGVEAFRKEFESMYVKAEPGSDAEKSLQTAFKAAKCNVCHFGTSKKNRNDYGKALATLLTKKDAKDTAKIHSALEQVAGMKSKADDGASPTFGELIQQGKLPGGDAKPAAETAEAKAGGE